MSAAIKREVWRIRMDLPEEEVRLVVFYSFRRK